MTLYRRNTVWWVRFTTPGGERICRSTGTTSKEEAQEYQDRLRAEIWKTQRLGRKSRRTWEQAAVRWLKEKAHKASLDEDRMHLRWLDRHLRGIELGGWESVDMVRRDAPLAPDDLAEFAKRLSQPRAVGGTNLAHDKGGKGTLNH